MRGVGSQNHAQSRAFGTGFAAVRIGLAKAALASLVAACSSTAEPLRGPTRPPTAGVSSSISSASKPEKPPATMPLGDPIEEALPFELRPMPGTTSVLAVANDLERGAFSRVIHADGTFGPIRYFDGANPVLATEAPDGSSSFVTATGTQICVSKFAVNAPSFSPPSSLCTQSVPEVVLPLGDRFALVSLDIEETKTPTNVGAANGAAKKKTPSKSAKTPPKKSDTQAKKGEGQTKKGEPQTKKKTTKKTTKKKKKTAEKTSVPSSKAKVHVKVAWATRDGQFDSSSVHTGLTFERPLAGMMLVDAASRGSAVDLLFYEHVAKPKQRSKTPFGSARLAVASLGADGLLMAGSRAPLIEADLEYGSLSGMTSPRLVSDASGSALISFAGRGGPCRVRRVTPQLGDVVSSKTACQMDPLGAAIGSPIDAAKLEEWVAMTARRAPGQTKTDAPLVTWSGDQAWFVDARGALVSSSRTGPTLKSAPAVFPAKRSRLVWSAFAPDGEGVAFASARLFRLSASGDVREAESEASLSALGRRGLELIRTADLPSAHRNRVARIGSSFWFARHDLMRLTPEPKVIESRSDRAHPDASVLIGGAERGMLLEIVSGALNVTFVAPEGSVADGPVYTSPVRAGFDAVSRAAKGAIVAGVDATDPTKVITFRVDERGAPGPIQNTSLRVPAGAFGVRISPWPTGGALLTNVDRTRAVWLDDNGVELASAPLSAEKNSSPCAEGTPAPLSIPTPIAGQVVPISNFQTPGVCLVGEPAWTASGELRWFGVSPGALDAVAHVGVVKNAHAPFETATPTSPPAPLPAANAPPVRTHCPAEMVSIADRFCIDRFESTLFDAITRRTLSPDFPATPNLFEIVLGDWVTEREHWGDVYARSMVLPPVPTWQRGTKTEPVARPLFGARPNGYVTGLVAESACAAAGKRLCTLDEHTVACRGEADQDFPYGADYQDGVCNVFREDHPAALLHHNASIGHLDPRLNRVAAKGKPLFETAGARPACRSTWGSDAVYDLVGNLDEWVDEEGGAFAGGFYSRSTRAGCDAVITAHPKVYADYSTGIRCCKDAK
ncbi:MAG: hypothetical protein IPK82_04670 [Polyangiaceae bacterium]|nr:hypothetical protein [Polyangiaceae bacterium]